jgi:eukaryotic-like serine/threonine-protein kinase
MTKDSVTSKEVIKLFDFGLVKILSPDEDITQGSNLTEVGEACGTPFYMSPEQIIGQTLNPTADIYSLGVILYQMLTGKMPIEGTTIRQILALKINHDVPPPSTKFSFLPSSVDRVLLRVLARDPKQRYQTAGELLEAFEQVAGQITNEFSQVTEPSIDMEILAEVRQSVGSPSAASYLESPPTAKLNPNTTGAGYHDSAPTSKLTPPTVQSPSSTPEPVAGQAKTLWIVIAALLIVIIGLLVALLARG